MRTISTHKLNRRGYTLLEILLVLTVLVLLSSLTLPALGRLYQSHRLEEAGSNIQVLLSSARVHAAEAGVAYQIRFETSGRRYLLVPANEAALLAAADSMTASIADEVNSAWRQSGELHESLIFGQVDNSTGNNAVEPGPVAINLLQGLDNADELQRTAWGPEILIYPDGTASDATFTISNEDEEDSLTITLRGLTGAARSMTTSAEDNR